MINMLQRMAFAAMSRAPLSATITAGASISENVANGPATTGNSSTVTASGGVAPYTYDWERVSGDTEIVIVAASDSAATTQWGSTGTDQIRSAVWRCKVTDNASTVAYSGNVSIEVTHGTPP